MCLTYAASCSIERLKERLAELELHHRQASSIDQHRIGAIGQYFHKQASIDASESLKKNNAELFLVSTARDKTTATYFLHLEQNRRQVEGIDTCTI
jgi:hypothetical protein